MFDLENAKMDEFRQCNVCSHNLARVQIPQAGYVWVCVECKQPRGMGVITRADVELYCALAETNPAFVVNLFETMHTLDYPTKGHRQEYYTGNERHYGFELYWKLTGEKHAQELENLAGLTLAVAELKQPGLPEGAMHAEHFMQCSIRRVPCDDGQVEVWAKIGICSHVLNHLNLSREGLLL